MENNVFWAFLAVTFIIGLALGIAIYGLPAGITGRATIGPMLPGISCNDTDGGINLALKGTCIDPYGTRTDVCSSPLNLVEYWCMNGTNVSYCVSRVYNCREHGYAGCFDGACIGGKGTLSTEIVNGVPTDVINEEATPTIPGAIPQTTGTILIQSGCTYPGVLDMLNKCKITHVVSNFTNVSCNNICQQQGKTCTNAFSFDPISKVTVPYECSRMKGGNNLFCSCCSTPITNATISADEVAAIKSFKETGGGAQIYNIQCGGGCCWTPRVICCWDNAGCSTGCCTHLV